MNAAAQPTAYRGPFPFRSGVTCADFDSDGQMTCEIDVTTLYGTNARVMIVQNAGSWVMQITEGGGTRFVMLGGADKAQLRRIWNAFDRVLWRGKTCPWVAVGNVMFHIREVRAIRTLIGRVLQESPTA